MPNHLPPSPIRFATFLACCMLLLSLSPATQAQAQQDQGADSVQVSAELQTTRLAVGDRTYYIVSVQNGKIASPPATIPVEGLSIRYNPSIYQEKRILHGGKSIHIIEYYYVVAGLQEGSYTIPEISLNVDGRTLTTQPQTLTVYKPAPNQQQIDPSEIYSLLVIPAKTTAYVNEMIPVTAITYARGKDSIQQIGYPSFQSDNVVVKRFSETVSFDVKLVDIYEYSTATRESSLFAIKPGTISMGAASIDAAVYPPSSGGLSFFQQQRRVSIESRPVELNILPLPEIGKPDNFNGAVGKFQLIASANPTTAAVGDPVSVELKISGPGNFEALEVPQFSGGSPAWRTYPARKEVTLDSDGQNAGLAKFTQILIPNQAASEIPSFSFSFFDPESKEYRSLETGPIPVTISPAVGAPAAGAGVGTGAPAIMSGSPDGMYSAVPGLTPQPQFEDILFISTAKPAWQPGPRSIFARPWFWLLQLIPAAVVISLLLASISRALNAKRRNRKETPHRSFEELRAALNRAKGSRAEFYHTFLDCIAAWNREHAGGEVDGNENAAILPPAVTTLKNRADWLVYGFAGPEKNHPPNPEETREAAQALHELTGAGARKPVS